MKTLGEIKANIEKMAAQIDIPVEMTPSFGKFVGQYAYVYVEGDKYHWVMRGDSPSISDVETADPDELLYQVFTSLTEQMGMIYEVLHRDPKLDPRRVAYRHQSELLKKLNPTWELRRAKEIEDLITWYPYKDHP
jgi:hypothetical protein